MNNYNHACKQIKNQKVSAKKKKSEDIKKKQMNILEVKNNQHLKFDRWT